MKLALLRHGPTEWNAAGRVQGHTDIPLSEAGLAKMSDLRLPLAFQRSYCSPLLRARQTAEALGLTDVIFDPRLMEQHWGIWEGLSLDEIRTRHGTDAFARAGEGAAFRPGGGETTGALNARVADFLTDVARGAGDAVAVTHTGVVRAAYTLATGWDMATPMPAGLDLSKIMLLSLDSQGAAKIDMLNLDFSSL
ncbi:MAG: histidine phosphatase family protein [Alphaproteobacteria bacterium]|nr:histidine phosphatase family protein [Alphaproteobacteria bacterium]